MAYKNIEDSRAAIRRHYYANKEKYLEKNKKRRQQMRDYVHDIKTLTPCTDCGISYPAYVMDFDHLGDKEETISRIVLRLSFKRLTAEIAKCEIVCSNCHRMRTFSRLENTKNDLRLGSSAD